MQVNYFIEKNKWNEFLATQPQSQFLQSFEWGEFQESAGNKIFRLGIEEDGRLLAVITLIKKNFPLGFNYFYCPDFYATRNPQLAIFILQEIAKLAKKESCIFLRFEAESKLEIGNFKLEIKKTIDIQPRKTIILDISKPDEGLLKAMHPKTRYNIRLAEKKGVTTRFLESGDEKSFTEFWKIMQETGDRDGFRLHGKEHYRKMLDIQRRAQSVQQGLEVKLLIAEHEKKIIAGNIVAFFGDTATYVHGASGNTSRNLMPTFALQWQSIKSAKERGCKYYDLYGIDEVKWPGVTRFKRGFGGEEVEYAGTFDVIFSLLRYNAYKALRQIRRIM